MKFLSKCQRLPLILAVMLLIGLVWGSVIQAQTFDSSYVARRGDSHQTIASRHGISVALLQSLNPYVSMYLEPKAGSVYRVPTAALIGPPPRNCAQLHTVNPNETMAWVSGAYGVPLSELAYLNNLSLTAPLLQGYILCLPSYASLSGSGAGPAVSPSGPVAVQGPMATQAGPWTGYYYNFLQSSAPVLTRTDAYINFDWGTGSPGTGVGADNFSVVWQGNHHFTGGNYRFVAMTDDGVRVWVGGVLVIDGWKQQATTLYFADFAPPQGTHQVHVEYYESSSNANVSVNWAQN